MDRIQLNRLLYMLVIVFATGLLFSCSDDNEPIYGVHGGNEAKVSFSVNVPGTGTPKTYALNDTDENQVKDIVILLFDSQGKYTRGPIYVNEIKNGESNNKKTFTAGLPVGTYKHIVILANSSKIVYALGKIAAGTLKADVLSQLLLSNSGKWNSDSESDGYLHMPMWGEISNFTVSSSMTINNPVQLVRMVAKIDISLNETSQTKFKLKNVRLYNYNDKGLIAPDENGWDAVNNIAIAPTIPSSATKPSSALVYNGTAIKNTGCVNEIYTFEAIKGTTSDFLKNTCLVIGGNYDGDTQQTYYRVDFARTVEDKPSYFGLLRNHHYKVNIIDVLAPGHSSVDEAFKSAPVNIKASIVEWNDGRFTDFAVSEHYILGVSQSEFNFSIAKQEDILSVITDYSGGWNISKIVDGAGNKVTWLKCSPEKGNNSKGDDITLSVEKNASAGKRTAYIHITAERLTYIVKVNQDIKEDVNLQLTDAGGKEVSMLEFIAASGAQPDPQVLNVNWSPASMPVSVSIEAMMNGGLTFSGSGITNTTLNDGTGLKSYTIQPEAITASDLTLDPFSRTSLVVYTASEGESKIDKTLILRQSIYNLVATPKPSYTVDKTGITYSFNVRSNTDWRIKSVDETSMMADVSTLLNIKETDNLRAGTTGGYNMGTGTEIKFTTINRNYLATNKIKVVFESTASPANFSDVTVEFDLTGEGEYYPPAHKGWAGSNIYWNATTKRLTFDDVGVTTNQKNEGVSFAFGGLWGISLMGDPWTTSSTVYPHTGGSATKITWDSWPHVSEDEILTYPPNKKTSGDRAYLYELTDGATTGIGDICKYMTEMGWAPPGKKWRMPTHNEFNSFSDYGGWITGSNATSNATGTNKINSGRTRTGITFFPASSQRYDDGSIYPSGNICYYWCSSIYRYTGVVPPKTRGLAFMTTSTSTSGDFNKLWGYPVGTTNVVRCVVSAE